ncbi:MAG: response regulator [Acidobacteriota bacterium]
MAKKILLADDSLTIQKVVELTFSDSDYELICVSNGQLALDRVLESRPDLILADVVMPDKNGYEVCEAIKGNPSTARIPVVLLSGTFEPFDRERAERIGADAIVSKPFDSHQLLAQVDALIARAPAAADREPEPREAAAPAAQPFRPFAPAASAPASPPSPPPAPASADEAPFDTGFSSEDFTASVRMPHVKTGMDPFEAEYGRGDVDSAIEAFEKSHPRFGLGSGIEEPPAPPAPAPDESGREPLAQWLRDEPERAPFGDGPLASERTAPLALSDPFDSGMAAPPIAASTMAISRSDYPPTPPDQLPTMEFPLLKFDRSGAARSGDAGVSSPLAWPDTRETETGSEAPAPPPAARHVEEISAYDAEVLFDVGAPDEPHPMPMPEADRPEAPAEPDSDSEPIRATEPASLSSASIADTPSAVPGDIEMLAQRSSIPELTQMLSSVRAGGDMTDEQIERLATRVVEKLSDRVVREIAWEVIPDMAEIVIKQRIKELESGVE